MPLSYKFGSGPAPLMHRTVQVQLPQGRWSVYSKGSPFQLTSLRRSLRSGPRPAPGRFFRRHRSGGLSGDVPPSPWPAIDIVNGLEASLRTRYRCAASTSPPEASPAPPSNRSPHARTLPSPRDHARRRGESTLDRRQRIREPRHCAGPWPY
jgi:hypothetical protein